MNFILVGFEAEGSVEGIFGLGVVKVGGVEVGRLGVALDIIGETLSKEAAGTDILQTIAPMRLSM